jgi:hypothetical protein
VPKAGLELDWGMGLQQLRDFIKALNAWNALKTPSHTHSAHTPNSLQFSDRLQELIVKFLGDAKSQFEPKPIKKRADFTDQFFELR